MLSPDRMLLRTAEYTRAQAQSIEVLTPNQKIELLKIIEEIRIAAAQIRTTEKED